MMLFIKSNVWVIISWGQLVNNCTWNNRFEMIFLVWFKCPRLISQVNGQVGNLKQGLVPCMPIFAYKLIILSDNNFACQWEITVKPGVPETSSVCLHIKLIEAMPVFQSTKRRNFQDRRVRVTTNYLVQIILFNLWCLKSHNCRVVSR